MWCISRISRALSPDIQTGDLLEAIEMAIPVFAIEQAISLRHGFALCDFNLKRAAHGYFNLSSLFSLFYAASYKIGIICIIYPQTNQGYFHKY